MKKFINLFIIIVSVCFLQSCELETAPTDAVTDTLLFSTIEGAQVAVNGIYRSMHDPGWSTNWSHENPGFLATPLVKDLHGEDHLMSSQGQGWFYFDYAFWIDEDFTHASGRQYSQWTFFYNMVSQANYLISRQESLFAIGTGIPAKNVVAQAYAIRAFAYTCLYEWFCQGNYADNSDAPGVPIYTEPTVLDTEGKPRGTVAQIFALINEDFQRATDLFKEAGVSQQHSSHIDLYTAYALWARAAMITAVTPTDWAKVQELANAALDKPGLKRVATINELGKFNDRNSPSVMWAFEVITDQVSPWGYFLSHMDPEGGYGARAPQEIDAWLHAQIPDTDERKTNWWGFMRTNGTFNTYWQNKFRFSNRATGMGDQFFLRAEEAVLIAAEAACRQGDWATARSLLMELGSQRDTDYASRLALRSNDASYNSDTRGTFDTLMDEVLFQRRIELWSEGLGRAFDLRRLNLGYTRNYDGTNHPAAGRITMRPGDPRFVTLIPQIEFNNNHSFRAGDQNPR